MLSRPQLGVCTWTFGALPFAEIAQKVAALQYDGVALFGNLEGITAVTSKQILADHNLTVFSVTPPNIDLAHPDTAVRQAALDVYTKLLDFAAECEAPYVVVRGQKGRTRPLTNHSEELALLVTAVQQLATEAQQRNLKLAFEVLNRYETHLVNTAAEALDFVENAAAENVGILLNAFHMNIEEQDAASAIRQVGAKLWQYHLADSNRQAIGRGHSKLGAHLWGLEDSGYKGPLIMEMAVPGLDPVTPVHDNESLHELETYLQESRRWF